MNSTLARAFHASDGTVSVIVAGLALVLIGFAGLAIDVSSVVYWKRQLQGATDAAALAAAYEPARANEIIAEALQKNGLGAASVTALEVGDYSDDPSLSTADRFNGGSGTDAVHLTTTYDAPLYFLKPFLSTDTIEVSSEAIAHNLPIAGISVGSGILDADTALLDSLTEAVTGDPLGLSDAEIATLAATRINLFGLLDKLAEVAGSRAMTIAQVQAASLNLADFASAAEAALAAQAGALSSEELVARNALTRIALEQQGSAAVTVSDVVGVKAHQKRAARDLTQEGSNSLSLSPMNLMTGYLQAAGNDNLIPLDQTIAVPGVLSITIKTIFHRGLPGGSNATSGSTVGPAGSSASATTARMKLEISLLPSPLPVLGLISLSIPLLLELGQGTATVSDISCGADIVNTTDVAVTAQSALLRLWIGAVTDSDLTDFTTDLTPVPVVLAPLVTLDGQASLGISGQGVLHFNRADIAAGTTKSINGPSSIDLTLDDLVEDTEVNINIPLIGGLLKAALSTAINTLISNLLSVLSGPLETLLASLGLRAGYLDVTAESVRCGLPVLVD